MRAGSFPAGPVLLALSAALVGAGCRGPGAEATPMPGHGDHGHPGVHASSGERRVLPPETTPPPGPRPEGHRRMVERLARLDARTKSDNPFLGREPVPELDRELAALGDSPDLRRWLFNSLLCKHRMRLGEHERAVAHCRAAYDELQVFPGEIPEQETIETIYNLGVAWMRWGEVRNCALRHTPDSCLLPIRGGGVHVDREPSTEAARLFAEVMARTERDGWWHVKARWLHNIAMMTLGRYPDAVAEDVRIPPERFASDEPFPRFFDVAQRLGLDSFDMSGGAAVEDYDGDGRLDIVTTSASTDAPMRYYRNLGDGRFQERAIAAGLGGITGGLNLTHADYDNDGDVDLLVLRGAWWRAAGRHPDSLLANDGHGVFTDRTYEAGMADPAYPGQNAAWADYDGDGDLDVFIGHESAPDIPAPSQLYRNNGDGTFTDVAAAAGVTNDRFAKGSGWGDVDEDGLPDLYVSNMGSANRLYRNNGDGTFTDIAARAGVERPISAFPTWFWDYDNDGHLDLFVAGYGGPNLPPDVGYVAASYLGIPNRGELDRLYLGDGRGVFRDVSQAAGIVRVTLPMGANYGDLDNDGWLDYYLGTGYPYYEGLMPNVMMRNREGRGFADVTTAGGFGHLQKGHGIVFADLDDDGDQDVYEQIGGMYPGDAFGNVLFQNPGFGRHWIKLRLVGVRSNRFGVGARVRLRLHDGSEERTIWRTVGSGGSFGANPFRLEIGLGEARRVEELEIRWPASGRVQRFADVPADRALEIREDGETYRDVTPSPLSFGSEPGSASATASTAP